MRKLLATLPSVEPYPEGVLKIPERIPGTAFFAGGFGLWNPRKLSRLPPMPSGGVMILRHDFDSEESYTRSLAIGDETEGPTSRNLLALLSEIGIAPADGFFTNAYMGMREGGLSIGRFPGASNAEFVDRCRQFLQLQIEIQKPRLILTLGRWVPSFIAPLSPQLSHWEGAKDLGTIDSGGALALNCFFGKMQDKANVVALTHACLRAANVGRRC